MERAEVYVVDVYRYKHIVGRETTAVGGANAAQMCRSMVWVYGRYAKDKAL